MIIKSLKTRDGRPRQAVLSRAIIAYVEGRAHAGAETADYTSIRLHRIIAVRLARLLIAKRRGIGI